jgi:hypothetical protein
LRLTGKRDALDKEALFDRMCDPQSSTEIKRIVDSLERDAPPLLEKEWDRVKRGEPIYRAAK